MQINTKKRLYEAIIARMNKTQAPSISVREFNYELNDVILDVVRDYAIAMEAGQIPLDYLRNLKEIADLDFTNDFRGALLTPTQNGLLPGGLAGGNQGVTTPLPSDYRHVTGVIVCFEVTGTIVDECFPVGSQPCYGAKRYDAGLTAATVTDVFLQPRYYQPGYSVIGNRLYVITGSHTNIDVKYVQLQYIKQPKEIIIDLNESADTQDSTTELEFDLQLNYEIASRLAQRLMERDGNPRMGTHTQSNQLQTSQDVVSAMGGQGAQ